MCTCHHKEETQAFGGAQGAAHTRHTYPSRAVLMHTQAHQHTCWSPAACCCCWGVSLSAASSRITAPPTSAPWMKLKLLRPGTLMLPAVAAAGHNTSVTSTRRGRVTAVGVRGPAPSAVGVQGSRHTRHCCWASLALAPHRRWDEKAHDQPAVPAPLVLLAAPASFPL